MSSAWPVIGIKPNRSLDDAARRILAVRIAEVYSYRPIIHRPEAVEPTHALRISLKRLRYTLELFGSVFEEDGDRQTDRVKALQQTLGDLHDLDVRLDLIDAEADRQARTVKKADRAPEAEAIAAGLARYADRERLRRTGIHRQFVEQWNAFQQAGMRRDLVRLSQTHPDRSTQAWRDQSTGV